LHCVKTKATVTLGVGWQRERVVKKVSQKVTTLGMKGVNGPNVVGERGQVQRVQTKKKIGYEREVMR